MNIAGVGPAELLVILIIALLVFGPQKLPEIARDLGKSIGKWRQALSEIQSVAEAPMKEVKELKEALDPTLMEKKLQESVQQIVTPVQQDQEKADEQVTKKEVKELKEALDPSSMEKKLQESVQQIVTPVQQDQEKADEQVTKEVEKSEGAEAKDECQTSSG